jgi:glycosyltransferase involved in cell wall biosynthesis
MLTHEPVSITIVIANHNKAAFLESTIHSAIEQEHVGQVVVVDDASSDGSIDIIRAMAARYSLLEPVFLAENRGQSFSENVGLRRAGGNFVLFLDSDDLLDPGCCGRRVRMIESFPNFDAWVFPMHTFDTDPARPTGQWVPCPGDHLFRFLSHRLDWQLMQAVWRRDLLLRCGGFDERFKRMTDIVFHTRALLAGARVKCFPHAEPDARYRTAASRITLSGKQLAERYVSSAVLYYDTFLPLVDRAGRDAIGGTLVAAAELICTWRSRGAIDQESFRAGAQSLREACRTPMHRAAVEAVLRLNRVLGVRVPGLRRGLVALLTRGR